MCDSPAAHTGIQSVTKLSIGGIHIPYTQTRKDFSYEACWKTKFMSLICAQQNSWKKKLEWF